MTYLCPVDDADGHANTGRWEWLGGGHDSAMTMRR